MYDAAPARKGATRESTEKKSEPSNERMQPLRPEGYSDAVSTTHHGSARVLCTAPHSMYLMRGTDVHALESCTWLIAREVAAAANGTSVMWSGEIRARYSTHDSVAPRQYRDPNYLLRTELPYDSWHAALRDAFATNTAGQWAHFDIHGRADVGAPHEQVQLELSTKAVAAENAMPDAPRLAASLQQCLTSAITDGGFRVNRKPRFSGAWVNRSRVTNAQQSALYGHFGVQLELCAHFRKQLHKDEAMLHRFAAALLSGWSVFAHAEGIDAD
eukprot:TRINITY_DN11848_c0_g1_i1.p1 TRINITY_DN11848_c0_g1~~TRINITY_DN11848_c0_g1_i1.p1  ORF type:complete len:272 (+),score=51.61 TRINITY_DN11848_c0_g1_i1:258-1073(+)